MVYLVFISNLFVKIGGGFGVVIGFVVMIIFGLGVVVKGSIGFGFFVVGGFDVLWGDVIIFGEEGVVGVVFVVVEVVVGGLGG